MCGCTLYDSPTCGHSWMSMSQPCGFLSDFLNCPYREIYQTLIAPPYTCPVCNGGFADQETIEMVQGPWGCNQMLRDHVGGNHAIPGQWGDVQLIPGGWQGPAITSGVMAGGVIPMGHVRHDFTHDHRLTGPYTPTVSNTAVVMNGPVVCDSRFGGNGHGHYVHGRRRRSRHTSQYKYKYTDRPTTNCITM